MAPVFVINLARDAERRAAMVAALDEIGMAAEFVPAVDGRALSDADRAAYDRRRCLAVYGVDMLPSELGCYLSHYRLCERIVREEIEAALVLEDDVRLDPALPAIVDALLAGPAQDWRVVRLNTLRGRVANPPSAWWRGRQVAALPDGYGLYRLGTHVLGAGGYLIKRAGAARMVEYGRRIFMPIDHTMDRFWDNGIVPYVVRPFPVHHRADLESRIGARPPARHRDQPFAVQARRRLQRLKDGVRKRAFNLMN